MEMFLFNGNGLPIGGSSFDDELVQIINLTGMNAGNVLYVVMIGFSAGVSTANLKIEGDAGPGLVGSINVTVQ